MTPAGTSPPPVSPRLRRRRRCTVWAGRSRCASASTRLTRTPSSRWPPRTSRHGYARRGSRRSTIPEARHRGMRCRASGMVDRLRSEEHTSELQSQSNIVCRLLLEKKTKDIHHAPPPSLPYYKLAHLRSLPRLYLTLV